MASSITIRPQARTDVVELAVYIANDSVEAARRFLDACESAYQFLAKFPQIGSTYATRNSRLGGLRVVRVKGFPNHLAFYLEHSSSIEIVRVVHGARDLDVALQDEYPPVGCDFFGERLAHSRPKNCSSLGKATTGQVSG